MKINKKVTKLQKKLNSYYESSKETFGENAKYFKKICEIAGNRGLSHEERSIRINNWTNYLKDTLNDSEKTGIDQILRINTNYVKSISRTREIKNSHDVREKIYLIRKDIRGNKLENNVEFNGELSPAPSPIETIKIKDYLPKNQETNKNNSYFRNTGNVLIKELVTAGIAAAIIVSGIIGNYLGKERQQIEQQIIIKNYEKIIKDKDNAIALAGRPDDEVRTEAREKAIEDTTTQLKTNYEKNIERVNKEVKKQVAELLGQKKDLEEKLVVAGRPDDEVRTEARERMVEGGKFDVLDSKFKKASGDYEEEKIKSSGLIKKNEDLRERNINLANKKATSDEIVNELTKIVDGYVKEREKAYEELNKPIKLDVDDFVGPLPLEKKVSVNNLAENRMARLEDANSIGIKPQYLRDKFWTYANEFGEENNKNFRKGPLELVLGIWGIAYQGIIVANKTAETILTPPAEIIGGVGGVISNVTGINKNISYEVGAMDGKNFVKRVGANSWGGRSITDADGNLIGAAGSLLTLNFKEVRQKLGKGLSIPTKFEEGWFNKLTAEGVYIFNHIAPFIFRNKGHKHNYYNKEETSKDFGGRRISEGSGGNGIISGGETFGGVGGR
ncbi:MAG TPA: hypothetical protein VJ438_03400 [Candidatus Nanoarchaeia archaeon]|nr:hypothetical protein [Candidatus Nanoarchaeia archaeon]